MALRAGRLFRASAKYAVMSSGRSTTRPRPPQVDLLVDAHVGRQIVVVLVESRACAHVEQVPHRAASHEVPASSGHVLRDQIGGCEDPAVDQPPQTADVTDFDTDIKRCGVAGVMPLA